MDQSESENYPDYIDARDIADFDRCNLKYYYGKTPIIKGRPVIYATAKKHKNRKSKIAKSQSPAKEREINHWILLFVIVIVIIILLVIFL